MLKIVWMSDPHYTVDGLVLGHDPRVRLEAAISHINRNHGDADFCVISGDMVNRGTAADYVSIATMLQDLAVPLLPMVGNHDDRTLFRRALALPDRTMEGFIQYAVPAQGGLIVCLDTQKPGADSGEFCATRMEWLKAVLTEAGTTPALLFMHHPPMPLGLPMQDTDRLEDGSAFLDLIARFDSISFLCIGHVHRPIAGAVRGIPYATMRSILYQAPAPQPEWDWSSFAPGREAPALGLLTLKDGNVTMQYEQFCDHVLGVRS